MNEISIDTQFQIINQDVLEFPCYYNLFLTEILKKARKVQEKIDSRNIYFNRKFNLEQVKVTETLKNFNGYFFITQFYNNHYKTYSKPDAILPCKKCSKSPVKKILAKLHMHQIKVLFSRIM